MERYFKGCWSLIPYKANQEGEKMKALVSYPQRKLYETLAHYAEEVYNCIFDEEHQRYGYYFNPNMKWDWFSIGGRWADLFLVKTSCLEYFQDDRSWTNSYVKIAAQVAISGYVPHARKISNGKSCMNGRFKI